MRFGLPGVTVTSRYRFSQNRKAKSLSPLGMRNEAKLRSCLLSAALFAARSLWVLARRCRFPHFGGESAHKLYYGAL